MNMSRCHSQIYLEQTATIARAVDWEAVERIVQQLVDLRARGGRLFIIGVGGSAANASHAVNDFRKLAGIDAYSPCDNVAEVTARVNDDGWDTVFEAWLRTSCAKESDVLFVLSVGGGDAELDISVNIVRAIEEAKRRNMTILGVVGRESYTKRRGDEVIVVPNPDPGSLTPHAEAFQAVIWHALVSHPKLLLCKNKWEGLISSESPSDVALRSRTGSLPQTFDPATLRVKLFADGADLTTMGEMSKNPLIAGFTTNPSLMLKAGVTDYPSFARDVLRVVRNKAISFEVVADDLSEVESQARIIHSWGSNVYVKVPVTNSYGEFCGPLIRKLSSEGIKLNITAVLTSDQVKELVDCLSPGTPSCISVFAGRIADTGRDPLPIMKEAVALLRVNPMCELIWASTREFLNIFQADSIDCHIITVPTDLLKKLTLAGEDLATRSLDTVREFRWDAIRARLSLDGNAAPDGSTQSLAWRS